MRNRFTIVLTALVVFMSLAQMAIAESGTSPGDPTELCERQPDHLRCQDDSKPPVDPCERNPEHRRCLEKPEEPLDRCVRIADNPRRCVDPDLSHYRKLFWRLVNAGEWKLLIRLFHALGLV